jgi:hypothetical protein
MRITNTITGKRQHVIAGEGPLVITKVELKTGAHHVSFDMHTSLGRYRGVGAVHQGKPMGLFNDTAHKCELLAGEFLLIELFKDSDALSIEIEVQQEEG